MSKLIPPHPFPARMSPEVALSVFQDAPKNTVALDPMCGSGTALRAAGEHGLTAIGFDLDPLAVLMAKVWNSPLDTDHFMRSADLALDRAVHYDHRQVHLSWIDDDPETKAYVDYWFDTPQQRQLRCLVRSIRMSPLLVRPALELALSRTIITKESGASLARDVSHSRPHKVRTSNDFNVNAAFMTGAKRIAAQLALEPPPKTVRVSIGDARALKDLRTKSIGLVLTSPPYLNAIDYMRGHRLSLVWLGYRIGALRTLRANCIGSERGPDEGFDRALVEDLMTLLPRRIDKLSSHRRHVFERYFLDIYAAVAEISRVMKREAKAVFVIGNSTVEGIFISNADALTAAATRAGLKFMERYERDLPPTKRYLPPPASSSNDSLALRMRSESVLSFSKAR